MTRDEALDEAFVAYNIPSEKSHAEAKAAFLASLKASGYDMSSEVELSTLRDRLAAAERGQKEAIAQMCKTARELGEAQGKLLASELPGIIDGWRERAEAAEVRVKELEHEKEQRPWIERQQGSIMRKMEIQQFGWQCEVQSAISARIAAESHVTRLTEALEKARDELECLLIDYEMLYETQIATTIGETEANPAVIETSATIAAIDAALQETANEKPN